MQEPFAPVILNAPIHILLRHRPNYTYELTILNTGLIIKI